MFELHGFNSCGHGAVEDPTGFAKTFHVCPKCSAALLCGSAFLWNGLAFRQDLDEAASSVAPSAATTPAAAKTAALIQEFNVEQGPGWIFGVMGGSVASVTTDTDNLWDELVLDSGSVSTACPYGWCSDISLNNEDKVHLQDIQQRRIPSHGSRVVPS